MIIFNLLFLLAFSCIFLKEEEKARAKQGPIQEIYKNKNKKK